MHRDRDQEKTIPYDRPDNNIISSSFALPHFHSDIRTDKWKKPISSSSAKTENDPDFDFFFLVLLALLLLCWVDPSRPLASGTAHSVSVP